MPTWVRTVLAPPSQPTTQRARTLDTVPSAARSVNVAPSASCTSAVISVARAIVTLGSAATRSRSTRSTGGWLNTSDGV